MAETLRGVSEVRYRKGYRTPVVKAEIAFAAVEKIRKKNDGTVTPEAVVEACKGKPRHPLYKFFEWNDTTAAAEYRKEQARCLLRSFIVVYAEAPKVETRAFHVITQGSGSASNPDSKPRQVYCSTDEILADPDTRADLLTRALRELVAFQRKFRGLQELAPIFRTMNEVLETVEVAARYS